MVASNFTTSSIFIFFYLWFFVLWNIWWDVSLYGHKKATDEMYLLATLVSVFLSFFYPLFPEILVRLHVCGFAYFWIYEIKVCYLLKLLCIFFKYLIFIKYVSKIYLALYFCGYITNAMGIDWWINGCLLKDWQVVIYYNVL